MPPIDPVSLIYTNALVSLVVTAVLWVSRIGLRDAGRGVRTWIVAELALAAARGLAIIDLSAAAPVFPFGALVVPCTVAMLGLVLHLEALRRVAGVQASPTMLVAQVIGLMLVFAWPASQMESVGHRALWFNAMLAWMALMNLRWLWPQRRVWGARLMAAMMLIGCGAFVVRLVGVMLGLPGLQMETTAQRLTAGPILLDMLISLFLTTGFLLMLQERLRERIERLVVTDALTGALNRHGLMPLLERELARAERHDRPLSVALFDLDFFKRVNDQHGHAMGDQVLAGFVARVHGLLRGGDLFGRWGGEEFLLVLPETGGESAAQVAERIRADVARAPLTPGAPAVTVSSGVASAHDAGERTRDLLALLDRADRRLYLAKQGRNRVVATDA